MTNIFATFSYLIVHECCEYEKQFSLLKKSGFYSIVALLQELQWTDIMKNKKEEEA